MSNPQHLPSFYASILFQSRLNPYAVAVSYGSRNISYLTFCKHIEAVTRRLHAQDIPAGSRVGVTVQEGYLKWIAVIALARLGLCSVSLYGFPGEAEFVKADVVLSDAGKPATEGRRNVELDAAWLAEPADLPPFTDVLHDPDAPCRIVLSSGTTGQPKKALFTYGHLRARSRGTARVYGLNGTTSFLTTMSITTIGGFWTPINVWSNGGKVILTQPKTTSGFAQIIVRERPNMLTTSTAQLGDLIDKLPQNFWPTEHLVVYVAGSALPMSVNRRARMRLSESLFMIYGSTEAGTTTLAHASLADSKPQFTGFVLPTAQVEIVDAQDQPVPNNTMGEVRIRAEGLVDHYLEDAAAQDGSFKDGWFYPGDAGMLDDEGGLRVIGRTRELMNFGGFKIAPDSIEEVLLRQPGVDDMAVFAIESASDGPKPYAAIVAPDGLDVAQLNARYKKAFPGMPALSVVRVDSIPRNDMGKIKRMEIQSAVQKELKA